MIQELIDQALDILATYGVSPEFFNEDAGFELIESVKIIFEDKEEAFCTGYEVATYLLEGMVSVMKERSLEENESGYHTTADGRLVTSVVASQDGLQEDALTLIQSAKGADVLEIYSNVLQPINLHCPTCNCESEICSYDEVIEKREEYLMKLKEVLGKQD